MARGILKLYPVLLVLYTGLLLFNLLCVVGIIRPGDDAPPDNTAYWKFANLLALLWCFAAVAHILSVINKAMEAQFPSLPPQMDMC